MGRRGSSRGETGPSSVPQRGAPACRFGSLAICLSVCPSMPRLSVCLSFRAVFSGGRTCFHSWHLAILKGREETNPGVTTHIVRREPCLSCQDSQGWDAGRGDRLLPSASVARAVAEGPGHFWEKHAPRHGSCAVGPAGLPSFLFLKHANLSFQFNSLLRNLKEF